LFRSRKQVFRLPANHRLQRIEIGDLRSAFRTKVGENGTLKSRVINFIQKKGAKVFAQGFVRPLFYAPNIAKYPEHFKLAQHIAEQSPHDTLIYLSQAMRERPSYLPLLNELNCPVKWIIGRQDSLISLEVYHDQIWLPPNSSVEILDNLGHMGLLENPQMIARSLLNFTKKPT